MLERFILYGAFGWCAEIVWTALYALVARARAGDPIDRTLAGKSYLWMFPIYGGGLLVFEVAHGEIADWVWPLRGVIYMTGCFAIEAATGWVIERLTGKIPWDYSYARWHVRGLIRLDYAPVWFAFGLLAERIESVVRAATPALAAFW